MILYVGVVEGGIIRMILFMMKEICVIIYGCEVEDDNLLI